MDLTPILHLLLLQDNYAPHSNVVDHDFTVVGLSYEGGTRPSTHDVDQSTAGQTFPQAGFRVATWPLILQTFRR